MTLLAIVCLGALAFSLFSLRVALGAAQRVDEADAVLARVEAPKPRYIGGKPP